MDQRFWPLAGLGILGLGAVVTAWWVFSVDTEIVGRPGEAAEQAETDPIMTRRERWRQRKNRRGRKARAKAEAPAAPQGPELAPAEEEGPSVDEIEPSRRLEPEELVWVRTEYRSQRVADMVQRLKGHAREQDWPDDLTAEVRDVMVETMETITARLTQVDRGDEDWHEVKVKVREYRERRARLVEELLGPERFDTFVESLGFERFEGEEPLQGRVRMKRRPRGKPKAKARD